MKQQDFTISFLVDQTPEEVYNAINNVRGWWSEALEGSTHTVNDEFIYRHKDLHYSKHKVIELIPGKRVVWLTMDSSLSFAKNKTEWTGTQVSFDIAKEGSKTKITFTHTGLSPQCECYDACSVGWNYYLQNSLLKLITTGKGQPDKAEEIVDASTSVAN